MKIVLLALDREPDRAERMMRAQYPQAEIEVLPIVKIDNGGVWRRLNALRALKPDMFAVATERLAWQQGQNALLVFGALGGAHRLLLFDAHGGRREEGRSSVLARAPLRLANEARASLGVVKRVRRELDKLEQAVKAANQNDVPALDHPDANHITYLRTTPAASQSGGAATHTSGFINAAVELGAHLSVITNDRIPGLDETRVTLTLIEPDALGLTRSISDLRHALIFTERAGEEIARQAPAFIYQRYSRFNWSGVEASLRTGRPLFLEYNGSEVWMARHWGRLQLGDLLETCERLNLAAAARVFVVADVERNNLIKSGVDPARIVVNPNGVDAEKFRPGVGGAAIRKELAIAEDEAVVGFVGTFGPWHGVLTLAAAITQVPLERRIRFLLVGAGMYRDEVERIVREAGRESQTIFAGHLAHERVPALLDACDILLSPHVPPEDGSEFFGSPTKLFEYMAMGKAIVASRLGQLGEVLTDEESALLIEPGNASQLVAAILRLSESPELRERLGAAARVAAITKHTWKHNAQRVLDSYRDLIEREQ